MNLKNAFTRIMLYLISGVVAYLSLSVTTHFYYAFLETLIIVIAIIIGDLKKTIVRISRGIGVSITGFIIPLAFSIELVLRLYQILSRIVFDFVIGLIICILINYLNSITHRKIGVLLLDLLTPLLAISAISVITISKNGIESLLIIPLTIVLASFSSIIGLDLLNMKREPGKLYVLGGNHVFDAIFLESFLAPGLSYAILVLSAV